MLFGGITGVAFVLLVLTAVIGGVVAGMGGPGGLLLIIGLNFALVISPAVLAATSSSIFLIATIVATGLYWYSDGIDWEGVGLLVIPSIIGSYLGTLITPTLPANTFEAIVGFILIIAGLGIIFRQWKRVDGTGWYLEFGNRLQSAIIGVGGFGIGMVAGTIGIGGPALSIPFLILIGISPITAIGIGLGSGAIITMSSTLGHVIQGNGPPLRLVFLIGIPYVSFQIIGWYYVHQVSQRTVSYSIAAVSSVAGAIFII